MRQKWLYLAFAVLAFWSIASVFIIFRGSAESERLGGLVGKYRADSDELARIGDELAGAVGVAQGSGRSASDLLAEYRRGIEDRERERRESLERIIGQASAGGIGAFEIADGIDGDIKIARRVEKYAKRVEAWIRELQDGIRKENSAP